MTHLDTDFSLSLTVYGLYLPPVCSGTTAHMNNMKFPYRHTVAQVDSSRALYINIATINNLFASFDHIFFSVLTWITVCIKTFFSFLSLFVPMLRISLKLDHG